MKHLFHTLATTCKIFLSMSLLLSFLAVGIFGLGLGMEHKADGSMKGCFFMMQQSESAVCTMDAVEHLLHWQQFFMAAPKTDQGMLSAAIVLLVLLPLLDAIPLRGSLPLPDLKLQRWRTRIMKLFDYLLQALSRGILRPKVY